MMQIIPRSEISASFYEISVNTKNTSKICSQCGTIADKTLSDRIDNYPVCGLTIDRDLNAAKNILRPGL